MGARSEGGLLSILEDLVFANTCEATTYDYHRPSYAWKQQRAVNLMVSLRSASGKII